MTTDLVRHGEGFRLVVGHENRGDTDPVLDRRQLDAHVFAQVGVERRERFVEQQHVGFDDDGARQRDALLLAAG